MRAIAAAHAPHRARERLRARMPWITTKPLADHSHSYRLYIRSVHSVRKPPVETAYPDAFEREMVCSLICKQMSKRDDGDGSFWS